MQNGNQDELAITILHGSQTGTATDYAARLFHLSRRHHFQPLLRSLADFDLLDLLEVDFACFVVSTTGQGEIPNAMLEFWELLLRADLGATFLDELSFCILGLGDSKYPQFNFTAKKLRRRLIQLGATEVLETALCDESANEGLDTASMPWTSKFEALLQSKSGVEPIGIEVRLPPIYSLRKNVDLVVNGQHSFPPKRGGHMAIVKDNVRVTTSTHFQDVRHITFRVNSELAIEPGDILSFTPENSDVDVTKFLGLMKWQTIADDEMTLHACVPSPALPAPLTLRNLAKYTFPLTGVPSQSLFMTLQYFCTNPDFTEKFRDWETVEGKDDFFDYITRSRRTLLEVLEDFSDGIDVDPEYALDLFGLLMPREYSISNAAVVSSEDGRIVTDIELIVALVTNQTRIKKPRVGVASAFLATLASAAQVEVGIKKNAMPKPIESSEALCICPGTGFAPVRFLLNRLPPAIRTTLVFGCRSEDDNFPVHPRLKSISEPAQMYTAFSRTTSKKQYVQHILRSDKAMESVRRVVESTGGLIYLSGSSGNMPDSVRESIDAICGPGTVERLLEEGRWWEETW